MFFYGFYESNDRIDERFGSSFGGGNFCVDCFLCFVGEWVGDGVERFGDIVDDVVGSLEGCGKFFEFFVGYGFCSRGDVFFCVGGYVNDSFSVGFDIVGDFF